jgi:NAD(P)-dependent dehydrogenase (short-subunit alcohol dehydrogenase family)
MNEDKIVVVTGAGRGLGLAIVKQFAGSGWSIVGTGLSERSAAYPESAEYYQFDASDAGASHAFWQSLKEQYPTARFALINNAGGYVGGKIIDLSPDDFIKQMNANYFSAVFMTKALTEVAETARIVTIVSDAAYAPRTNSSAYGASKAAEQYFLQTMQKELPSRYQLTNVYPDAIATHGPDDKAIHEDELASLIKDMIEFKASYYLKDVTVATSKY